jgi:hypothetical protein
LNQIGQGAAFHINHVIPRSKGGSTNSGNLVLQCTNCSLHKAAKLVVIDQLTGAGVGLFHPLLMKWEEHFQMTRDGHYRGISAIGRATVDALGMNRSRPLVARSIQIQLGLMLPSE